MRFYRLACRLSTWVLGVFLALLVVAACRQPLPAETTATPVALDRPVSGPDLTPPATAIARASLGQRPLTIWAPAALAGGTQAGVEQIIATAIDDFAQHYAGQTVELVLKADEGQASLLNYVRSAQRVAPAILPDLLLLDARQIWQVAELGLAQPLTPTQLAERDGFYPFAWDAVRIHDRYYGVPYFAAPVHLVYNPQMVATAPTTWPEVIASGQQFAFAGGGSGGYADDWLLLQYLNAGGELGRGNTVRLEALARLFAALDQGRTAGTLPPEVLTYSSDKALWTALVAGNVAMVNVPANVYLSERAAGDPFAVAPVPGIDSEGQTIAEVYAFIILTDDNERRTRALALIDYLLAPEVQGAWAYAVNWLPARSEAFKVWPANDEYMLFAQQLLKEAISLPGERSLADLARRLQQATASVMSGELTPDAAVATFE